jgi:hypothetical protein
VIEAGIFALAAVQQAVAWVTGRLLTDGVTGIVGNRVDDVAWWATRKGWKRLQELRTTDPKINHDLQRALRKSYLLATQELLRQSQERMRVQSAAVRVLSNSAERNDEELAGRARRAVETELNTMGSSLPELSTGDADLLVLDDSLAPEDRLQRMHASQMDMLRQDMARWLGDAEQSWIPVLDHLLEHGWIIQLESGITVQRHWHQLISMAFVEELKNDERLRAVFEARILAELKNRDTRLAPVSDFAGFQEAFDRVLPPLQQIEKGLAGIQKDVSAIRDSVVLIDRKLEASPAPVPRWVWAAIAIAVSGAVGGAVFLGSPKSVVTSSVHEKGPETKGNIEVKAGDKSPVVTNSRTGDLVIHYGAEPPKPTKGASR